MTCHITTSAVIVHCGQRQYAIHLHDDGVTVDGGVIRASDLADVFGAAAGLATQGQEKADDEAASALEVAFSNYISPHDSEHPMYAVERKAFRSGWMSCARHIARMGS